MGVAQHRLFTMLQLIFRSWPASARRNAGSALLTKPARVEQIVRSVSSVLSCPLTIKVGLIWTRVV